MHSQPLGLMLDLVSLDKEDDDELFKPPKMEDEDFSLFGGKGGLFSGGKGLFDDDEVSGMI